MAELSELVNELRLRVPDKAQEFYVDCLRWSIDRICRKTSVWQIQTDILTVADTDIYDIDLPTDSVIYSNLYIIQKGNTDKVIKRPPNGFKVNQSGGPSDWLDAFKTAGRTQIQIFPMPKDGGVNLEVHTAIAPTKNAVRVDDERFFEDYADTVVYGALFRCFEVDRAYQEAQYNEIKFKEGYSSIHSDVLKEWSDTPAMANYRG